MSVSHPALRPMSRSDYEALDEAVTAEYVDGAVVMTPGPGWDHQEAVHRIRLWLEHVAAPPAAVQAGSLWETARGNVRIPDVVLAPRRPSGQRLTEPPLVAVEVLSGNRADDLVRKSTEYLEVGVSQYWVVDPARRSISVYDSSSGWTLQVELDEQNPRARVRLPRGESDLLVLDDVLP